MFELTYNIHHDDRRHTTTLHRSYCSFAQRRDDCLGTWEVHVTENDASKKAKAKGYKVHHCSFCRS